MKRTFSFSKIDLINIVAFSMFIVAEFFSPTTIHENYFIVFIPGVLLLFLSLYYIEESRKYILETIDTQETLTKENNYRNHFFVGIICLVISIGLLFNSIWIVMSSLYLVFLTKRFFVRNK
jgi:hypothetical protein